MVSKEVLFLHSGYGMFILDNWCSKPQRMISFRVCLRSLDFVVAEPQPWNSGGPFQQGVCRAPDAKARICKHFISSGELASSALPGCRPRGSVFFRPASLRPPNSACFSFLFFAPG